MKRFLKKIWSFSLHHLLVIVVCSFISLGACAQNKKTKPGEIWNDTNGQPINAHGGGILYHNGTYFWFGEILKEKTWLVSDKSWECYRTDAGGVSCYSSKNLIEWKHDPAFMFATLQLDADARTSTAYHFWAANLSSDFLRRCPSATSIAGFHLVTTTGSRTLVTCIGHLGMR